MQANISTEQREQARKFLFDLAFDARGNAAAEREKPKPTFSQEQMDAAKAESYAAGIAAGKSAAQEEQNARLLILLDSLCKQAQKLSEESAACWQDQLGHMQALALTIARKLMPHYAARHGLEEIETVVAKVLADMGREPRLVFRVSEKDFDTVKTRVDALATSTAYAGKLVILGDESLGDSECRVEWADGGIERDVNTLWQAIDRVMEEVQTPSGPETPTKAACQATPEELPAPAQETAAAPCPAPNDVAASAPTSDAPTPEPGERT